ncbi:hypothetical protein Fleli_0394 [Bernardetia litoralis DSM 6794]|uniref:Uncharacterized protein n=1 Tax=Bernardetia litoralis (strain ATCC 23117 / DSM 6794 / NBRC 15988 / NCIMB 1366 / Fx l1 / Sio-4) TaxID=880071 RepID=I4AFY6_BERLS|nr:hypothetical protein [Bernardetia litoralis]AFM02871.1 hypothetical protein Fleli_0394 [Bernardetia litoralis DSM 6794]
MMMDLKTKKKLENEFSNYFENPHLFKILVEKDGLKTLWEYDSGLFTLFSSIDVANFVIAKLEKLGTEIVFCLEKAQKPKAKMSDSKTMKVIAEPYDLVKHGYMTEEEYEKAILKYNKNKYPPVGRRIK